MLLFKMWEKLKSFVNTSKLYHLVLFKSTHLTKYNFLKVSTLHSRIVLLSHL